MEASNMSRTLIIATLQAATFIACNPCDPLAEARRIMANQTSVQDCGDVRDPSSRSEVAAIVACMTDAIAAQRPFRAHTPHPRGSSTEILGRTSAGRYEVQLVGAYVPRDSVVVDAVRCERGVDFNVSVQSEGATSSHIVATCRDSVVSPLPPQPRYAPPSSVPIGQICPVL
jgi:hypothetical protein